MVRASSSVLSSPGEFINPSPQATSDPSWAVGSQQVISWTTSLTNYTIAIWNENPSNDGYTRGPALLESYDGSKMSLNWTVQTYEFSLSSSPVFYLLLQPGPLNVNGNTTSTTTQSFISHTFTITSSTTPTHDHKLGLVLALSLTIPFVLICVALAIYFIRAARRRAIENFPYYQYPYHVGYRHRRNRFFGRNQSPTAPTFHQHPMFSAERKRSKSSTNNNLPYFEPPPTTPKTLLSFNFSIKSLRGRGRNRMSQKPGQATTLNRNLSPHHPMHTRRPSDNVNAIAHLSPTYYPPRRAPSLTSTAADSSHIQQLQLAQKELTIESQKLASHAGHFTAEEIPHHERKWSGGDNGIDDQQQKWLIKPYNPPELPGQNIKKHRYEEPVESLASRRKYDYDEPMELW
ncbi:ser-thr- gpi-anchored family protein [Rutstroemia sp. NJR-2017a BVV2]|nr:ser-thr- gpi-anchored family protein [Rutstroemia sp. NJR-2017a BVV2]